MYLKVLEVDPGAEDLCRRLMDLYQRLGRREEALAVYDRCSSALLNGFGIHPSHEMEAMARSLRISH